MKSTQAVVKTNFISEFSKSVLFFCIVLMTSCTSTIPYEGNPKIVINQYNRAQVKELLPEFENTGFDEYLTAMHLEEFPVNKEINLFEKRVFQADPEIFQLKNSFIISSNESDQNQDDLALISDIGYLPGEKVEYKYISYDCNFFCITSLIPNPLKVISKTSTASLEAVLVSCIPASYLIKIDGLNDGEVYTVVSEEEGNLIESKRTFNENRSLIVLPSIKGKKGGIGKVILKRENGESLNLNLPWGMELVKSYLNSQKKL